jgi:hypothetical protein
MYRIAASTEVAPSAISPTVESVATISVRRVMTSFAMAENSQRRKAK